MELDKIYQGDALEVLKTFESESVNCIITSPPYFGLRDYGTAKWEGGDPNCDHKVGRATRGALAELQKTNTGSNDDEAIKTGNLCPKCGAKRIDAQIGLEKTPEAYVEHLVKVFHEAKRVLKKDGTFWLNMGDSYGGSGMGLSSKGFSKGPKAIDTRPMEMRPATVNKSVSMHKQLLGMPWRLAFALQADGWILRSDIIWNKPNPMPESVTDRCTKSHEYIFMLTKSERYYYDAEAIKEPTAPWNSSEGFKEAAYERRDNPQSGGFSHEDVEKSGRNKRDVWTVATQPCAEAHFATFPPKLIEPMILAGSRVGDTILDPFMGSGTTAIQAVRWHRHYLGCELNPEYVKMAERRIADMVGPLFEVTP